MCLLLQIAFGILKSNDGGTSFSPTLGGENEHIYSDIVVASDGTLIASLSIPFEGFNPQNSLEFINPQMMVRVGRI